MNAYPIIKTVTPAMPGPITLPATQTMNFTLSDSDRNDVLHVRVFIDVKAGSFYNNNDVRNSPDGPEDRTLTLMPSGWCDDVTPNVSHVADVVVADRMFNDGDAMHRQVLAPGKFSTRSWLFQCTSP